MKLKAYFLGILFVASFAWSTYGQAQDVIYDESKVPDYPLPDALTFQNGEKVTTADQWVNVRRPELLKLFSHYMYGQQPKQRITYLFDVTKTVPDFLNGKATLKEVELDLSPKPLESPVHLLIIIPNNTNGPVPAFAGLNFNGNHTVHASKEITLPMVWDTETGKAALAKENTRGSGQSRWPVEELIDRGYALITAYYGDIDPDFDDGFKNGIHPYFDEERTKTSWGSIGAWAWGLSRMMDYALTDAAIDQNRVAVIGHSRLGKTAIWAGAQDQRFAMVISNDSGCGGAALSRRQFGETIQRITDTFPHWFCKQLANYADRVWELPVDQHELIALIAPRPVYVASAEDDQWADPKGEFLSALYASRVYNFLGVSGYPGEAMPEVNQPVYDRIGYHIRTGKHDITKYDWEQYLNFADKFLKN